MPRSDTQFKPGQSGNPKGRPKGARSKVTKKYLDKLWADFKEHGASVLEEVRTNKPEVYLKLVADLVPKQFEAEFTHVLDASDLTDDELAYIARGGRKPSDREKGSETEPTSVH